jgi:hypothetical protein
MDERTPEARIAGRVYRMMAVIAASGVPAAWWIAGFEAAIGFGAGAAISFLNFRWLSQLASSIGGPRPYKRRSAILLASRYLIFAAAGYVIFVYSETGFLAALAGCCIHIAAVILEALYELIYAGTP